MLDLEKYFKQQAALAEQKRKLKKVSKSSRDNSISPKKSKLSSTDAKTSKRAHTSKHNVNAEDESLQTANEENLKIADRLQDNSSGSEYVPSDEIDSGNLDI